MNKRLLQFLNAENISQSVFADTIGVARASVSHILAGRNKPGFDFIESMGKHYPTVNLEWLITGKGKMYKQDQAAYTEQIDNEPVMELFADVPDAPSVATPVVKETPKTESNTLGNKTKVTDNQRQIEKILILYSDGSYQELK